MSTIRVGDVELFYEEHGSGDPLLLIMGFATDSTAWLFQLPEFAARYRTIAFRQQRPKVLGRSRYLAELRHQRVGRHRLCFAVGDE